MVKTGVSKSDVSEQHRIMVMRLKRHVFASSDICTFYHLFLKLLRLGSNDQCFELLIFLFKAFLNFQIISTTAVAYI